MAKKVPSPQQRVSHTFPVAHFDNLMLGEQVRRATPIAKRLIEELGSADPVLMTDLVAELLPDDEELNRLLSRGSDDERARLADWFEASRAIGVALGLMLRPEAFVKGGAR